MEELIFKLLEQTPLVILLGVGIFDFRNKVNAKDKELAVEREAHRKDIAELNDKHALELKQLNAFVREHEKQHLEALDGLTDALESLTK